MAADFPTFASVIRDILHEQGEAGEHLVARFSAFGLRALDQLGYAVPSASAKHVRLDIGARREAVVPDDATLILRVSAQVGDYEIPLTPDDRISNIADTDHTLLYDDNALAARLTESDWGGWWYPTDWRGGWCAPWSCHAGTYRYFPDQRTIRLGTALPSGLTVNVTYLPATHVCGPDTPVSPLMREAITNFCLWKHKLAKNEIGVAREYERSYRNARDTYRLQHLGTNPYTIARISDEAAFGSRFTR